MYGYNQSSNSSASSSQDLHDGPQPTTKRTRKNKVLAKAPKPIPTFKDADGNEFHPTTDRQDEITWDMKFDAVVKYGREHGTCNIPQNYQCVMGDGILVNLGKWLCTQRTEYKKKTMKPFRIPPFDQLVSEGLFQWEPTLMDDQLWYEKLQACVTYGAEFGHLNFPKDHVFTGSDGININMRNWVSAQTGLKRKDLLKKERYEAMEKSLIEPGYLCWDRKADTEESQWVKKFETLCQIGEQTGTCNINDTHVAKIDGEDIRLGAWLYHQRAEWRKGTLKPDRADKLDELVAKGWFKWDGASGTPEDDNEWDLKFAALCDYCNNNLTSVIPDDTPITLSDGSFCILNRWLARQKKKQVQAILTPEREAKLQTLVDTGKMTWTQKTKFELPEEPSWTTCIRIVNAYITKNGTAQMPRNTSVKLKDKPFPIGWWLNIQRAAYRGNRMPSDRVDVFQDLVNRGLFSWKHEDNDRMASVFSFDAELCNHELIKDILASFSNPDEMLSDAFNNDEMNQNIINLLKHIHRTNGAYVGSVLKFAESLEPKKLVAPKKRKFKPDEIVPKLMGGHGAATSLQQHPSSNSNKFA